MKQALSTVLVVAGVALLSSCVPPSNSRSRASAPLPPCYTQPGFSNTTLTVVTTVKPAAGKVWNFPEAPSYVSAAILTRLNADGLVNNLRFQEASGVTPNIYINITLDESTDGTHRDTAYANVTGFAAGHTFNESSGQAPFTSWPEAANSLSDKMYPWFANGWSLTRGCSNGTTTTTGRKKRR